MYSVGPFSIHLSPGCRATAGLTIASENASLALSTTPSFSPRMNISWIPFSSVSPGCRKKLTSPFTSFLAPSCGLPLAPTGLTMTAYWRLVRVVISTLVTTRSYTSGMKVSQSAAVTRYSSPDLRILPRFSSLKLWLAATWTASLSVRKMAVQDSTTSSYTPGRYAPFFFSIHSSPATRLLPFLSTVSRVARSLTAVLGLMMMAASFPMTQTSFLGTKVPGPSNSISSPAFLSTPASSVKSRSTLSLSASSAGTTVRSVTFSLISSPG